MNSVFLAIFFDKGWIWIDARDFLGNGIYIESHTGLELTYDKWNAGEPNYFHVEQCGYMATRYGVWNNVQC